MYPCRNGLTNLKSGKTTLIMSKCCNQLIITNKYMKNLASILSTVLLAVTAILLVQSVLLEYYGITAKQSYNEESTSP